MGREEEEEKKEESSDEFVDSDMEEDDWQMRFIHLDLLLFVFTISPFASAIPTSM